VLNCRSTVFVAISHAAVEGTVLDVTCERVGHERLGASAPDLHDVAGELRGHLAVLGHHPQVREVGHVGGGGTPSRQSDQVAHVGELREASLAHQAREVQVADESRRALPGAMRVVPRDAEDVLADVLHMAQVACELLRVMALRRGVVLDLLDARCPVAIALDADLGHADQPGGLLDVDIHQQARVVLEEVRHGDVVLHASVIAQLGREGLVEARAVLQARVGAGLVFLSSTREQIQHIDHDLAVDALRDHRVAQHQPVILRQGRGLDTNRVRQPTHRLEVAGGNLLGAVHIDPALRVDRSSDDLGELAVAKLLGHLADARVVEPAHHVGGIVLDVLSAFHAVGLELREEFVVDPADLLGGLLDVRPSRGGTLVPHRGGDFAEELALALLRVQPVELVLLHPAQEGLLRGDVELRAVGALFEVGPRARGEALCASFRRPDSIIEERVREVAHVVVAAALEDGEVVVAEGDLEGRAGDLEVHPARLIQRVLDLRAANGALEEPADLVGRLHLAGGEAADFARGVVLDHELAVLGELLDRAGAGIAVLVGPVDGVAFLDAVVGGRQGGGGLRSAGWVLRVGEEALEQLGRVVAV
jgi:hypothetical protein